MDRALLKLLRLRFRSHVRQLFRGAKTVRGALMIAVGGGFLLLWLGSSVLTFMTAKQRTDPESVQAVVPLILLGMCVLQAFQGGAQKGIYFSPAEVDFLFTGPFSRRGLLVYKICGGLPGVLFVALVLSVVLLVHASSWLAAFVGCFLTFLFTQLFSTAAVLVSQTVSERAYTRLRRLLLLTFMAVLAAGAAPAILYCTNTGFMSFALQLQHNRVWLVLSFPLQVFGRTFTAQEVFPELVGWAGLALAVDVGLLLLVTHLDVNYLEASAAVSEKIYKRLQRARRGRGAWAGQKTSGGHLPRFPWLGGAGPIAWRQSMAAIRSARGMTLVMIFFLVVVGAPLLFVGGMPKLDVGMVVAPIVFVTMMFTQMLAFDFRGDLDYLDYLKSLPLRPTAMTVGQLLTPALLMTVIHLLLLGGAAAFVQQHRAVLLVVAVFALPFNLMFFGLENLVFLQYPRRMVANTPGDLRLMGRTMVEMFVKMLVLAALCGVAAGAGWLAYLLSGRSWTAFVLVAWLALAGIAAMMVPGVAWAFRRFDVSVDTPP